VARAEWTYELPPLAGDSVWLEEYLVYDRDGEPAGQVFAVLEHEGRRWLGVEREHLPGRHDRRVVRFEDIRETDHENLAVHLALSGEEVRDALELDPDRGVKHGGDAQGRSSQPSGCCRYSPSSSSGPRAGHRLRCRTSRSRARSSPLPHCSATARGLGGGRTRPLGDGLPAD
jgi:hypothetical protein